MSHRYIILHQWLETDLGDMGAGKGESIGEVQKGTWGRRGMGRTRQSARSRGTGAHHVAGRS